MNHPSQAPTTTAPEEVRPVRVQRMLYETAELYEQMALMVRPGARTAADDLGKRIKQSESLPAPVDLYVVERMRRLEEWGRELLTAAERGYLDDSVRTRGDARSKAERAERDRYWAGVHKWASALGHARFPEVLRAVAALRIGVFVPGDDVVGAAFEVKVRHWRKFASETVDPTARRWRDMKVQCVEVIDDGEALVECTGIYGMWVNPHYQDIAPDLQCSKNPEHRVTPVAWQRAGRRSGYRPDAIRERLQRERANS